jgi:hypothetical protein
MSISPASSSAIALPSLSDAPATKATLLKTQIGELAIKDEIDLSKKAVELLLGGAAPASDSK